MKNKSRKTAVWTKENVQELEYICEQVEYLANKLGDLGIDLFPATYYTDQNVKDIIQAQVINDRLMDKLYRVLARVKGYGDIASKDNLGYDEYEILTPGIRDGNKCNQCQRPFSN